MAAVTGTNAVTTSFIEQYQSQVQLLAQQEESVLRKTVMVKNVQGKGSALMEQVGSVVAEKRTSRHGTTPVMPTPYDRRWVNEEYWRVAELVDDEDRLRQIIEPNDPIQRTQAAAMGRAMDDSIIEGILGTNKTGENGSTNTSFTAGNIVAPAATGLTIAKLRSVKTGMLNNQVRFDRGPVCAIISPDQLEDLLETTEVTSSDYNTVRALVQGEIDTFMGFKFHISTRLLGAPDYNGTQTITANNQRALFYPMDAVGLGVWKEPTTRITERGDLEFSTQIYTSGSWQGTRLDEAKVWAADSVH